MLLQECDAYLDKLCCQLSQLHSLSHENKGPVALGYKNFVSSAAFPKRFWFSGFFRSQIFDKHGRTGK